jgi:hypothetical protein
VRSSKESGQRKVPKALGVRGINGVGGDAVAGALGVGCIDDGRFVAVLEVKSADVLELRRGGDENARCRALLSRLELVLTRRLDLPQDGGSR